MRTGDERAFKITTLRGCTATVSEEEQRFAVERNLPMFSRPLTHDALLSALAGASFAAS